MACSGDTAKAVLMGEGDITTVGWPPSFGRLFGPDSLIMHSGPRHKYMRALMAPAFTTDAIGALVPRIAAVASRYLDAWAAASAAAGAQGSGVQGYAVRGYDELKLLTFEVILDVVLGRTFAPEELAELSGLFKVWVGGLFQVLNYDLPFLPFGRALRAREALSQRIRAVVADVRRALAAGERPDGVVANMVAATDEAGNRLSDGEIEDNVILMLFAGHDTSSTTLALALTNLASSPGAMGALREEQARLVAARGPQLDGRAVKEMVYAEAVIRETMRLDNIVGGVLRTATKDFELAGFRVPQGSNVLVPLTYLSSSDPRWQAPETGAARAGSGDAAGGIGAGAGGGGGGGGAPPAGVFAPERLLSEEGQKQGWLLPFGAGPRYCIGSSLAMAEMKVFLALLARGYSFDADTDTSWSTIPLKVPRNGLPLNVRKLQVEAAV